MNSNIDFLIVGAGLYGATMARLLTDKGYKCLILEQRQHIAGNIYTENIHGYEIHIYGPHIFHTDNKNVENFVQEFSEWIPWVQNTVATDGEKLYHLPFNMNTYYDIFGLIKPEDAANIIDSEISEYFKNHKPLDNLEDKAISMVGTTIYEKLIKNYTEKQWGKSCKDISSKVISRLPLRYFFNNNYFNDSFQGIPKYGYTEFVNNIIDEIPYLCDVKFDSKSYEYWEKHVRYKIIYCGAVDELLDYELGELEWRSLKFKDEQYIYNGKNGNGVPVLNDVSKSPITRYVEHMWFTPSKVYEGQISVITSEYPDTWEIGKERYYSINNDTSEQLYQDYNKLLLKTMPKIRLGGRLGKYRYFDMDDVILEAMNDSKKLINE